MKCKKFIFVVGILVCLIFTGCSNTTEKNSLKNQLQSSNKKILTLQNNIAALESDKKSIEDSQNQVTKENNQKGETLIKNIGNMDTLSKVIDAYYYRMDGAFSEQYSYTLYKFYQKEGMNQLVELLNNKDTTTIEGVSELLINEYVFGKNETLIENMIGKLNSMNSNTLSDKKKYIVLRLLERCYLVKSTIKNN